MKKLQLKKYLYAAIAAAMMMGTAVSYAADVEKADEQKQVAPARYSAERDLQQIKELMASRDPMNWVFTGDSITHALVHTLGERSYVEQFSERLRGGEVGWNRVRDVVIQTGISGDIAAGILNDFSRRVSEYRPHVVSVMIGMNDARKGAEYKDEFRKNVETLVDRIRGIGAIPVLHTMNHVQVDKVPIQKETGNFAAIVKEVAQAKGVILADHWDYWTEHCTTPEILDEWMNDPIHPNGLGHRHFAIVLFKALDMYDANSVNCQPVDPRRKK